MNIKSLIFSILLCITTFCFAQNNYQFGVLPSINLNKKLPNEYKLNFKLESRQEFKQGYFKDSNDFDYEYISTDISTLAAKKISYYSSLSIGYLLRIKGEQIISRIMQQYIITKKYTSFKLSHRIAADQTFQRKTRTKYRFRYRLSSEIPLNGQSVNAKEFYLKINNEYLNSFQNNKYDLEVRVTPFLGYTFSNEQKLEFGLDYRINSFIEDDSTNLFWIGINWYLSL